MCAVESKLSRLVKAAKMYYQLDYSQQKIANELQISRPSVSRLLHEAKEQGIVEIHINDPASGVQKLAQLIKSRFKVKDCIVVNVPMFEDAVIKEYLGKQASTYLRDLVKEGDIIGTTWGTTLYEIARHMQPKNVPYVKVVQMNGGISHSETNTYASEIVNFLGKAFDTPPHFLPLPAVVDHLVVKQAIVADRHIKRVLDLGKEANIAVFTVGDPHEESTIIKADYFSEDDLQILREKRAVGDICSRFFDIEGRICSEEINARTIGIELFDLSKKETTILVAGGQKKISGILGALNGNYANVLITDQFTAEALLEMQPM
ncbi:sugar-binding transcriptional regulator [Evansella tamaricis]|uniref:Sugar-binding transcriptional regulator n=1 Tax=Evansella tamaricis TaxID=2069301 RepID=A0ABS6JEZ2_9BACI|nr:sugar-binding transcriptional regulator [Evansella tamaricis]MBU9711960.1 sugar-binding transcriptional regulator [Evansella tamaricis]